MLAVLGLVILYINITLVAIFVVTVSAIAYQNIVSMPAITVSVVVLWMWMPAIDVFCRRLLLGYVIAIVPITAAAFVIAGYISIPSYPWLWAILIIVQAWCFEIQSSGPTPYVARAIGTMVAICIVVVPWSVLFVAVAVAVGSCCFLYDRLLHRCYIVHSCVSVGN